MRKSKMVERTEEIVDEAVRIANETRDPDYITSVPISGRSRNSG